MSTNYIPYATCIPPHVMLMAKTETLKAEFEKQATHIVKDMRMELNSQNISGDLYKAGCVLEKIKAANESFLGKLQDLSGTNTREYGQAEENADDYFVFNDQYVEEEEVKELEGHTIGIICPVAHTTVNNIKGMNIPWVNSCRGNIILTSYEFLFPFMTLPNMLSMWFCDDISKNIPPYRMLQCKYMKQVKCEKQKLSNMKTLVKHVMRAAVILNMNDLVVTSWSPRKVVDLYVGVRHFFDFPCLTYEKRRRTRQCHGRPILVCLTKRKGRQFGEQ